MLFRHLNYQFVTGNASHKLQANWWIWSALQTVINKQPNHKPADNNNNNNNNNNNDNNNNNNIARAMDLHCRPARPVSVLAAISWPGTPAEVLTPWHV